MTEEMNEEEEKKEVIRKFVSSLFSVIPEGPKIKRKGRGRGWNKHQTHIGQFVVTCQKALNFPQAG